jgi:cytochrome c-type protein NapC
MLPGPIIAALVVGVAIALLVARGAPLLASQRWGRLVMLGGLLVLPLLISAANLHAGVTESSQTHFCLSCHEMQRHGMSLFADNRQALAAVHYQNRLIDRDQTCYSCHKDYAMFGDVKAKLNGLRHVWVHYTQPIPAKLALYQPYKSANCLHCHDDARRFAEAPAHKPILSALYSGETSCLGCHRVAHDMDKVDAGQLWQAAQ